jgi:hypothetical protein
MVGVPPSGAPELSARSLAIWFLARYVVTTAFSMAALVILGFERFWRYCL